MGTAMSKSQGSVIKKLYGDKWHDLYMKTEDARKQSLDYTKNNLEHDLLNSEDISKKVIGSERYAQNLYAALCDNNFQKIDVIAALSETVWRCSWRSAGGIVADIKGEGDYIDWYCSGMFGSHNATVPDDYVSEGTITDEIKSDLHNLGWIVK